MDSVLTVKNENQEPVWQVVKSENQEPVCQGVKSENQEPVCEAVMSENEEPVCLELKHENQEPAVQVVKCENQEPVMQVVKCENQELACQEVQFENREPVQEALIVVKEPDWHVDNKPQSVTGFAWGSVVKNENQEPVWQVVKSAWGSVVDHGVAHTEHFLNTTIEVSDDEEIPKVAEIRNNKKQLIGVRTSGKKPHMCITCNQVFRTLTSLHVHACVHQDYPGFMCDICDSLYTNTALFRAHIIKCDPKLTGPGEEILNSRNQVIGKKLNKKWDWCIVCEKKYRDVSSHAYIHEKHEHVCEICGKSFKTRKYFTNHMIRHSGEYGCNECGRQFSDAEKLSVHRSSHEAVRRQKGEMDSKHECDECGRFFRDADKLALHRRGHQEEMNQKEEYICVECGQNFRYRMNFEKHVSMSLPNHVNHQISGEFKCQQCAMRFPDPEKLAVHRREKWRCKGKIGILHSKKLHSSVYLKNGVQSLAGDLRGQSLAGDLRGQSLAGDIPGQSLAGDLRGQSLAGDIPGQSLAGDMPGQSLARNMGGQSLTEDIPGQSLSGDIPGQSLSGDIPGPSLAGDMPGQSLARNIAGQSLTGDMRGQSLVGDMRGQSLAEDIPGQSLAGDIPGHSLAGDIPGQSLAEDIPGQSLAVDMRGQSLAGKMRGHSLAEDIPGQSLAGDIRGQSLAGDIRGQSLAGDIRGQSLAGDIPGQSLAGDIQGQSLAGDVQGQSLGGEMPGQSLAGEMPTDEGNPMVNFSTTPSTPASVRGHIHTGEVKLENEEPVQQSSILVQEPIRLTAITDITHLTPQHDFTVKCENQEPVWPNVKFENQEPVQEALIVVKEPDWHFDNKLQSYESVTGFAWDSVLEDCVAHNEHLLNTTKQCSDDEEISKGAEIRNNENQVIGIKTSGNTPYMCKCKRDFKTLKGLHVHQIVHQEHPVYVCDVCNRNYKDRLNFRTHVTSHCGKRFCCKRCGTRLATNKILQKHKCGHQSKKPGEDILNDRNQVIGKKISALWDWCIVCKTRVRHHLIQAHSKTHEYVCKICGQSFKHRSNFTNHVNSHKPEAKRLEPHTRGPKGERRIQGKIDIPCLDIIQID